MRRAPGRPTPPATDPDRAIFRKVIWTLIVVIGGGCVVAWLFGIDVFTPGESIDAEEAWRRRLGR